MYVLGKFLVFLPMLLILSSYLNSIGCNYKLNSVLESGTKVYMNCKFGKFNTIAEQDNKYGNKSIWISSGYQFNLFGQIILFVTKRKNLNQDIDSLTELDKFSVTNISGGPVFYGYQEVSKGKIVFIMSMTPNQIITSELKGHLDITSRIRSFL